jgi:hypothetical protein
MLRRAPQHGLHKVRPGAQGAHRHRLRRPARQASCPSGGVGLGATGGPQYTSSGLILGWRDSAMQTPLWRYLPLLVLFRSLFLEGCTRFGSPGIFGVPPSC